MGALRRLGLALVLLLAAGPQPGGARDDSPAPEADEIYIENVAPQALTFGLSPDNESWERFSLDAGQVAVYGGGPSWYFLILTEGVELRYRLDSGGSYRLYWSEAEERWDLMTCQNPACGRLGDEP